MSDEIRQWQRARASYWAAALTLAGFAVVVGAIGYSVYQLQTLEARITELEETKKRLQQDIVEKREEVAEREAELADVQEAITAAQEELDAIKNELRMAEMPQEAEPLPQASAAGQDAEQPGERPREPIAEAQEAEAEARRARLEQQQVQEARIGRVQQRLSDVQVALDKLRIRPRVYIHVRSRSQIALAEAVSKRLSGLDIVVPEVEVVMDQGPSRTQVRYFDENERPLAADIRRILAEGLGDERIELKNFAHTGDVRPNQFEIWFGTDA
ncbi:hypothetical protein [Spectribacter hydrogenoxidans]|uniref:Uncharacterized protein n=1 Tax=Spectribacter hydrogenoxidans TaxID=3075608 RepID=A0ABU3C3R5_9GAMM|nr:hypothetical protein [Salinisphaera sp. W335]MDT0636021.1 hypothetical protein [Salinisphaera sp. W335]